MTRLLVVFDIFFHVSSLGVAQNDHSAYITTIYKSDVTQSIAVGNQPNHSQLVAVMTLIDLNISFMPNQLFSKRKRQSVLGQVELVFVWIKCEAYDLLQLPILTTQLHPGVGAASGLT